MIGKRLLDLFRGGLPPAIERAASPLTAADRRAILADLAHADAVEAGLGEAMATYVVTGEGEAVLLRLENLLRAGVGANDQGLWSAMYPTPFPWGEEAEQQRKRLADRHRSLFGLEGFDPAALRRYAALYVPFRVGTGGYGFPGSDRSPPWFRALLDLVRQYGDPQAGPAIAVPRLRAMLAAEGPTVPPLLDCAYDGRGIPYALGNLHLLDAPGMNEALMEESEHVPAALRALPATARANVIGSMGRAGLLEREPAFLDFAFTLLASDGAKAVREAALGALGRAPADRVEAGARTLLASRDAAQRVAGVRVLVQGLGPGALPALDAHEAGESSAKVREAIATARATLAALEAPAPEEAREDGPAGYTAADGRWIEAPPWAPLAPAEAPADTDAVFRNLMLRANEEARRDWDAIPEAVRTGEFSLRYGHVPRRFDLPFDPATARRVAAVMGGTLPPGKGGTEVWRTVSVALPQWATRARAAYLPALRAFLDRPEVSLESLLRLCLAADRRDDAWRFLLWSSLGGIQPYTEIESALVRRVRAGADLRHLDAVAEMLGFSTATAVRGMLEGYSTIRDGEEEPPNPTIWPVLAGGFSALDRALSAEGARNRYAVDVAVGLLRFFPALPRRYARFFLDRAVAGNKRARDQARALLEGTGDLTPVILDMLGGADAARRAGGARWLADRRDPATVPALRAALAKEKNEAAKAAILAALAACGDDLSDQFSEERLLAEALAGLPKTKADHTALFDPGALPHLRWADGRAVPDEVVRWWFARAHALKQPGGDPLLHLALDRLDRGDAARLGVAVLSAFIAYDTRHPSGEEAEAYARTHAANWTNVYVNYQKAKSEEEAFAYLRRSKLSEYVGSALDHRGLLALARHAAPAEAVAMVRRYLRDHGKRSNQCRALVDALAANPAPAALQLILATSQRHKQPGTRKHAAEVAAAIAEENGWTPAELADRTVPTAGLQEDGALDLPVGGRRYRARLAEGKGKKASELTLVVENPDGKVVASLPSPSDPAEAEEAKAAKATLSAAKKELAQTVEAQRARLYAAMCTGRTWPVADFRAYLLEHPIVGRLLRRLVLLGFDAEGRPAGGFRALDDGTFSDATDEPVSPDGFAGIGIAHAATLGPEATAAWAAHLRDYEVTPLFEQLDRPLLAPSDATATAIKDREGWMLDNHALRAAATALGYQRGPIEDGGGFYTYDKPFPDLGLMATITFTGSFVPETERRPAALQELRFVRLRPDGATDWRRGEIPLGKVPPVLLSEAWNDLRAVAAAGTGHDPDWERKAGW